MPDRVVDGFVSFTDFAPTFLELAGIDHQSSEMQPFEGHSLVKLLKDEHIKSQRDFMVIGKKT